MPSLVRRGRRGFSLLELLIVVAIIGVLLSLVLVAVNHARARARSVKCLNNLRQLALGVRLYTDRHSGRFPDGEEEPWFVQIAPCLQSEPSVFRCPDDPQRAEQSYSYRDESAGFSHASLAGKKIDHVARSHLVVLFDSQPGWHTPGWLNVSRVNTSAETMHEDEFEDNLLLDAKSGTFLGLDLPPGVPEDLPEAQP